jgi:hypothetical protein
MILPKPDQNDFPVGFDVGVRCCADLCQRLDRVSVHFGHAAYRVSGGKHAAQSGRDEEVARFDIRVCREIRERKRSGIACSYGNRSQAGTLDLDRDGVFRVRDQDDFGTPRSDVYRLTDDSLIVEHSLSLEDSVRGTPIDQDALALG